MAIPSLRSVLATALLGSCLLVACGGNDDSKSAGTGSNAHGIASSKALKDLDQGELKKLCDWAKSKVASKPCGGFDLEIDCLERVAPSCDKSVGDYETCIGDLGGDICKMFGTSSCTSLLTCDGEP